MDVEQDSGHEWCEDEWISCGEEELHKHEKANEEQGEIGNDEKGTGEEWLGQDGEFWNHFEWRAV